MARELLPGQTTPALLQHVLDASAPARVRMTASHARTSN
jgi:hypothetical protein